MRYREKLNVRATSKATFSISGELWHSENNGVGGGGYGLGGGFADSYLRCAAFVEGYRILDRPRFYSIQLPCIHGHVCKIVQL